jgi:starvation-inducible DNA-binding protein
MASSSPFPTLHVSMSLPVNEQANALDGALADMLDLSLLAKHAHWNVVGPKFQAVHQLLEQLADFARTSADAIAERAATLGHSPDGRAGTITLLSSLPALEPGFLGDERAVGAFVSIIDHVTNRIGLILDLFENDLVSVNLFTGMLAAVEKYAWMLRAQRNM